MKLFGNINKTETQSDGTLKVWGVASSNAIDSDGEIITSEAMKKAIPDYMKFGAIREMHGSSAAGTALDISVNEDGQTILCAHIVDPIAILKIQTETYKGFSIGGKSLKRDSINKNLITEIILIEISLVDRPANPEAIFTMYKCDTIDKSIENVDNIEKEENMEQDIKKNLSDVSWLASIVQELSCLQECMEYEKDWEQDNSKLPEELRNIIKTLSNLLIESVKEETAELNSEAEKKDDNIDLIKYVKEIHEILNKNKDIEVNEDINKFEKVNEELQKTMKINEELSKRVKELEELPVPAKAILHVFDKNEELSKANEVKEEKVIYKAGTKEVDLLATAIAKAQTNPMFIK